LKIVTINILNDLSHWKERSPLLIEGLSNLNPDIIALQEVNIPEKIAHWLAEMLEFEHVYLSPKMHLEKKLEALAILSRFPFKKTETYDLQAQGRVAQRVVIQPEDLPVILVNVHLYWQPGESPARNRQVDLLLDWLATYNQKMFCIVCGDFNGTPETTAIHNMRQNYTSAYNAVHGKEPDYTCPTPLPRSWRVKLRTMLGFFFLLRPQHARPKWRGTLDYIFVNRDVRILDCQVVLNNPDRSNPRIYPSDHFGLQANVEFPS